MDAVLCLIIVGFVIFKIWLIGWVVLFVLSLLFGGRSREPRREQVVINNITINNNKQLPSQPPTYNQYDKREWWKAEPFTPPEWFKPIETPKISTPEAEPAKPLIIDNCWKPAPRRLPSPK